MRSREQRKRLGIGEGGEGYISEEMWCYNCANTDHLGDVSEFYYAIDLSEDQVTLGLR